MADRHEDHHLATIQSYYVSQLLLQCPSLHLYAISAPWLRRIFFFCISVAYHFVSEVKYLVTKTTIPCIFKPAPSFYLLIEKASTVC